MITASQLDDPRNNYIEVVVRVPRADLVSINLDALERKQLAEPAKNAADLLLDLHTLTFRQLQQEGRL